MAPGTQKNVRLSPHATELLRALKYDLDASDGEVIAQALEQKALERLRHHAAVLRRQRLGLLDGLEANPSRTAVGPLLAAVNSEAERYRLEDDALQPCGHADAPVPFGEYSAAAQAAIHATIEVVRSIPLQRATVAALLVACCASEEGRRCEALGIPVAALAAHLRQGLERQRTDSPPGRDIEFTPGAKAVIMEGAARIATLDGIGYVTVAHVLLAALQSDGPVIAAARDELGIDPEEARRRFGT